MYQKYIFKKTRKKLRDGAECVMKVLDKLGCCYFFYTGPKNDPV